MGQTSNTASREYVDHVLTQAKLYAEAIKSYIVTHFVGVLLAFLALILAFVWYLHNDLKQQMQANKAEAKQERREARQERREAKQERQAIHNKLNILIQAQPPATPQAKPTSS